MAIVKDTKIGNQIWMNQNLNVDCFQNGDKIKEAKSAAEWFSCAILKMPAWCYFENEKNVSPEKGKLYNWFAVSDSRGIAPIGWSIPTDKQWDILITNLGEDHAYKMISSEGWKELGVIETDILNNETKKMANHFKNFSKQGFQAFPVGFRQPDGKFINNTEANWWSSTEQDLSSAKSFLLEHEDEIIPNLDFRHFSLTGDTIHRKIKSYVCDTPKGFGLSVRCLKISH